MEITREDIAAGVRAIGVPPGATALVHSSLSSFGHVVGGSNSVIQGLLQALGPEGTVLFPTFTGSAQLGPDNAPQFDVRSTPCWTGCIPEVARQRADARRSLHPTHSVAAIGARTAELIQAHETSPTPCGPDTPFGRLAGGDDGYVVFLGVGLQCNTTFHHVEEVAGVAYHMQQEPVTATIVDYEGQTHKVRLWLHRYGPRRNFPRPEPYFLAKGIEKMGRIGNCTVRVLQARPMVEYVLGRVRQAPEYLLAPQ